MKIKVLQENLKNNLNFLQKIIPNKPQLDTLSNILLKTEKNKITLAATDLYLGMECQVEAEVENPENIIVPGEIFKNLIYSFSPGEITLQTEEKTIIIKHSESSTQLVFQTDKEYPQFPQIGGEKISLTQDELDKIETFSSFSVSLDQTKPVLTSLLFNFNNKKLDIVGTDGFRLTTLTLNREMANNIKLLIPAKAVSEVCRISKQLESDIIEMYVSQEIKQVLFIIKGVRLYIRLIEGEFPPYEKIIPTSFKTIIEVDGEQLLAQLKRAFVFARQSSNIIQLEIIDEKLIILSTSPTFGNYKGNINIKNNSKNNNKIAFNGLYLMDFLNTTKAENIIFKMNESLKPAVFEIPKIKDFSYIIMPFRTND